VLLQIVADTHPNRGFRSSSQNLQREYGGVVPVEEAFGPWIDAEALYKERLILEAHGLSPASGWLAPRWP
jgi:hypothetical protein